jgi:hypothetical protein
MFLVVFVTLVISIISLYAQVLGLEAKKIAHSQHGMMQTMLTWHNAAVALVHPYLVSGATTVITNLPCQVSKSASVTINFTPVPTCLITGATKLYLASTNILPSGYNTTSFTFYSLVAASTTSPSQDYVVTFVHDTDDHTTTGNLMLPDNSGYSIGYSFQSLSQQFANAAPPNTSFGFVTQSGYLTVNNVGSAGAGTQLLYSIPSAIPVGAFAVISAAN